MNLKRGMALAGTLAAIFFVSSILLFYKGVDQGITLSHYESMLTEGRQATDLLQVLVRSKLVGNLNRQQIY
jgi:hypothetical protein